MDRVGGDHGDAQPGQHRLLDGLVGAHFDHIESPRATRLSAIDAPDVRASRVFQGGLDGQQDGERGASRPQPPPRPHAPTKSPGGTPPYSRHRAAPTLARPARTS